MISLKPQGRYRMDQTLVLNGRHNLTVTGNGALFFAVSAGGYRRSHASAFDFEPAPADGVDAVSISDNAIGVFRIASSPRTVTVR